MSRLFMGHSYTVRNHIHILQQSKYCSWSVLNNKIITQNKLKCFISSSVGSCLGVYAGFCFYGLVLIDPPLCDLGLWWPRLVYSPIGGLGYCWTPLTLSLVVLGGKHLWRWKQTTLYIRRLSFLLAHVHHILRKRSDCTTNISWVFVGNIHFGSSAPKKCFIKSECP